MHQLSHPQTTKQLTQHAVMTQQYCPL